MPESPNSFSSEASISKAPSPSTSNAPHIAPRHWPGAEQERLLLSKSAIASMPGAIRNEQLRRLRKLKRAIGGYYDPAQNKYIPGYTCSASWFDAVWNHGHRYAPNSPCSCESCQGRRRFPAYYRGHSPLPRVNGQRSEVTAAISYECYLERRQIDPEILEELRPLQGTRSSVIPMPTKFRGKSKTELA